MSIIIYESRLIDKMIGDRSQMSALIIRGLGTPHGKSDLNPCVGKTPESMLRAFALIAFFDILPISPDACPDRSPGKLLEGVSARLVNPLSEAHESGLPGHGSIGSSAKQLLCFISIKEISGW
jgi:hypothetical protein